MVNKKKSIQKRPELFEITQDKIDLISRTVAKGATPDELKLFLYQCRKTGLDPLARQIYFVKRGGQVTIQTSIDGFRVIAERSKNYAGQDEPIFKEGSESVSQVNSIYPMIAKITIYRFSLTGERYPAGVGVAYWEEYKPSPPNDFMWKKMPHTMLAKVAEAQALRKAFPQDLSGLYIHEEMDQMTTEAVTVQSQLQSPDAPASDALKKTMDDLKIAYDPQITNEQAKELIRVKITKK